MSIHELQAALRALDEARERERTRPSAPEVMRHSVYLAEGRAIEAARRVAEGAGEPVAWGVFVDGEVKRTILRSPRAGEVFYSITETTRPLYAAPPSADALVEALGKLRNVWRKRGGGKRGYDAALLRENFLRAANELDALIAKHKENTDGR